MSRKVLLGAVLVLCSAMVPVLAQTAPGGAGETAPIAPPATGRGRASPHETVSGVISGQGDDAKRIIITYGRPNESLRGGPVRKIWGGLVPYGTIWRMGADESTTVITQTDLQFGDVTLPAGACSMYLLPVENGTSMLIFNKKVGQWGINGQQVAYPDTMKETEIGRVALKKDTLTTDVPQFTIVITPKQGGGGGTLKAFWEKTMYSVDYVVKK